MATILSNNMVGNHSNKAITRLSNSSLMVSPRTIRHTRPVLPRINRVTTTLNSLHKVHTVNHLTANNIPDIMDMTQMRTMAMIAATPRTLPNSSNNITSPMVARILPITVDTMQNIQLHSREMRKCRLVLKGKEDWDRRCSAAPLVAF